MTQLKNNYYVKSLSWSIIQKVLSALFGFISTPLLLGVYGKADYGILSIATACNGYLSLLDLGMNTGAVRFYSIWRKEGCNETINHVARTNITFYSIIALVNVILLLLLAWFGEPLFSISQEEFSTLRVCLYILTIFSLFNWLTTVFNQLLIADKQMTFTMQMNCLSLVARASLLVAVFKLNLSLTTYFFFLTACVSFLIVPYAWKCLHDKLLDSIIPATYWTEFKPVVLFSLSIFALSMFQVTATQSRPIILSMFAENGATCVTDFSIISVFPTLIITIGGTFTGIFLPKTSEMVALGDYYIISTFAYKWTKYTSVFINYLTIPFVLCSSELLSAYVGEEYVSVSIWLVIWCFTVLIQMHTTPANALVLAYGKTKLLVITTSVACVLSVLLNMLLAPKLGVGSAVISYFIYVVVIIGLYYLYYYKKLLDLSRLKMIKSFIIPTILALASFVIIYIIPFRFDLFDFTNKRISYLMICFAKTIMWVIAYTLLLLGTRALTVKEFSNRDGNM